jgi:hypothetical protein
VDINVTPEEFGKVRTVGFNVTVMLGVAGDTVAVRVAGPKYRVLAPEPLTAVSTAVRLVAVPAGTLAEVGEIVKLAKVLTADANRGRAKTAAMQRIIRRFRIRVFIIW